MADTPQTTDFGQIPEAVAESRSRSRISLVWVIPLVAALIGGWLAVKAILEKGPTITIVFKSAEGLEAGKTKIKYKDVEIGVVQSIKLAPDLSGVIATADVVKESTPHLVEGTRFWVVRPRVAGGSVSGLGTLLSGSYIGTDIGKSGKSKRDFVGLEAPPVVSIDTPGSEFVLRSPNIASLQEGSPLFFRRLQVGQVMNYKLDEDGSGVTMNVFVYAPYDKFVTSNTRFWNASGVDVSLDSSGFHVQTESILSIIIGGISFETPPGILDAAPAAAKTAFRLFATRAEAMKNPEPEVLTFLAKFTDSVRGLSVGAPVEWLGIVVGEVSAINIERNVAASQIIATADLNIYPARLRNLQRVAPAAKQTSGAQREFVDGMVARGLRARLRTGNLLTGQLFVSIEMVPGAPKAMVDWRQSPPVFPSAPGTLGELQAALDSISKKIDRLPIEEIGGDLRKTLQAATRTLERVDGEVSPEAAKALAEARKAMEDLRAMMPALGKTMGEAEKVLSAEGPLQLEAREAMREISRAAAALRALADYLERNPQALIRGKPEDSK